MMRSSYATVTRIQTRTGKDEMKMRAGYGRSNALLSVSSSVSTKRRKKREATTAAATKAGVAGGRLGSTDRRGGGGGRSDHCTKPVGDVPACGGQRRRRRQRQQAVLVVQHQQQRSRKSTCVPTVREKRRRLQNVSIFAASPPHLPPQVMAERTRTRRHRALIEVCAAKPLRASSIAHVEAETASSTTTVAVATTPSASEAVTAAAAETRVCDSDAETAKSEGTGKVHVARIHRVVSDTQDLAAHITAVSGARAPSSSASPPSLPRTRRQQRRRIRKEKTTYLLSAIAFSIGVTGLAFVCTYTRFTRLLAPGDPLPWIEIGSTLLFIAGAAFAMELWALWAHRALWHDTPLLWKLHKSHHEPRVGPFEANDTFAIINAAPAIALIAYGFFNDGFVPGLCYGAGLGITVFGMLYMFVHDGLVHRRFAVGPIGEVPYLKRVAAAHQVHHGEKFDGVPYGLFLGPWELEKLEGGAEEIDRILEVGKAKERRIREQQQRQAAEDEKSTMER